MSHIITFYSFKGGVGRTMALANVACAIAANNHRVLVVDWDLEAPGLHRYFAQYDTQNPVNISGTLGMLEALANNTAEDSAQFESSVTIPKTEFFAGCKLSLLAAGMGTESYELRVLKFDLEKYYRENGAAKLEKLREYWRARFDFVLIDSRTGITDAGGICTIFLPDTLALVFTANEQSLVGAIDVARRAQKGRQALTFDRRGLTIFPIPSRFDSRAEQEEAEFWMKRFSDETEPFLSAWCPRQVTHRSLLERIKIPHVAYFSFGEKLPVVTHTSSDPDLPGFYYQNIAGLLKDEFAEHAILSASGMSRDFVSDLSRIVQYAPAELIGRENEIKLLDDAWDKAARGEAKRPHIITFVALGGAGKTSLVAKWAASLAHSGWRGCEAAFAWSFYSQGASDQTQTSSDSFLKEALVFFGDSAIASSAASSFDKGRRLAQLVGERRALLILDGVEPLQYSPASPTGSELKDQGVAVLLKALASNNNGLCVITTRYSIPDLRNFWQTTGPEIQLSSLSIDAGAALLRRLGVKGTQKEFEQLVRDVKGHALTLNLLGSFLRDAHAGDIRKRDLVNLEEADVEERGGHAFRVIEAEVRDFESEGARGKHAIALLRLLGLFDRPASADLVAALLTPPAITGLTDTLVNMSEAQKNLVIKRLEDARLITVNRNEADGLVSLDAHPLLREYFAKQLRDNNLEAWRAAHRRLYEYLRKTTNEGDEPNLEDLQPLYQAVAHGCQAGLQNQAVQTYAGRIVKGDEYYSVRRIGAMASDLEALSCFFETPWNRISSSLTETERAWVLNEAAFRLRALGRLTEAIQPMRAGLEDYVQRETWRGAAVSCSNLSELELTLGDVEVAVSDAKQAVEYADRSQNEVLRGKIRGTLADGLNQAGSLNEADLCFRDAEVMQAKNQPDYPLMYSLDGFRYCDLLLIGAESIAWRTHLTLEVRNSAIEAATASLGAVFERVAQTLEWASSKRDLLMIGLHHLTLSRAVIYQAIASGSKVPATQSEIESAVTGLRRAGTLDHLPRALLTRAWSQILTAGYSHYESSRSDLDEAWEIAERGPMRLHMADIHLYRARLFHAVKPYPWSKFSDGREGRGPKDDLKDARKLIEQCGYWRRKEELEDAEEAAKNWA